MYKPVRSDERAIVAMQSVDNVRLIVRIVEITFHPTKLLNKSQEFSHRLQGFVRMPTAASGDES